LGGILASRESLLLSGREYDSSHREHETTADDVSAGSAGDPGTQSLWVGLDDCGRAGDLYVDYDLRRLRIARGLSRQRIVEEGLMLDALHLYIDTTSLKALLSYPWTEAKIFESSG
jgi:hypothetical protein